MRLPSSSDPSASRSVGARVYLSWEGIREGGCAYMKVKMCANLRCTGQRDLHRSIDPLYMLRKWSARSLRLQSKTCLPTHTTNPEIDEQTNEKDWARCIRSATRHETFPALLCPDRYEAANLRGTCDKLRRSTRPPCRTMYQRDIEFSRHPRNTIQQDSLRK